MMRTNVNNTRPTIFVVDDDSAVRDALKLLLRSVGQAVETYGAGQEFLESYSEERPGCLVLDVRVRLADDLFQIVKVHTRPIEQAVEIEREQREGDQAEQLDVALRSSLQPSAI